MKNKKNQWAIRQIGTKGIYSHTAKLKGSNKPKSQPKILIYGSLIVLISVLVIFTVVKAGSLTPSAEPGSTMKPLSDIPTTSDIWSATTRTLSSFGTLATEIVSDVWETSTSGLTIAGSIGKFLIDNIDAPISSRSAHTVADVWDKTASDLTDNTKVGGFLVNQLDTTVSSRSTLSQSDILSDVTPFQGADIASILSNSSSTVSSLTGIYDSSSITADEDGNISERLEYLKDQVNLPSEANVKLSVSYGISATGSLTPVNGAGGNSLDAQASDVATGKYFFGVNDSDWTTTLGTATIFSDYALQKNRIWDDWRGDANSTDQGLAFAYSNSLDQNEEEATWETYTDTDLNGALVVSGTVKKDTRTGLYWSDCYTSVSGQEGCQTRTNEFTLDGVIDNSLGADDDGLDAEGGQAVDFCEALSLDADGDDTDETDWYLPSQKELLQVYIDGSANNLSGMVYDTWFWSSTERVAVTTYAWHVHLYDSDAAVPPKSTSDYTRCVRR